jgi:FixJ family two-component response regulator
MTDINQRAVGVVDDDQAVRESLRFWLEVIGHPVDTFASAAEFLEADNSDLACLILDHHMPDMTGPELAERLRSGGNRIPIMLVTGSPSAASVARAVELDVDRVFEKPPEEADLLDFINAVRLRPDRP